MTTTFAIFVDFAIKAMLGSAVGLLGLLLVAAITATALNIVVWGL